MNHKLSGAIDQPSDDLEAISGIGPTVANRLNKYGIRTFEQVAALTPVQAAELIDHVPARRIIKENWIGQARQLAAKRSGHAATNHQHYATFTLEFLLDEHQAVRRTQVRHVQSGAGETWANWDEKRLLSFVADRGQLRMPATAAVDTATDQLTPLDDSTVAAHMPRLTETKVSLASEDEPRHLLESGQPFYLWLTIDLSGLALPVDEPLDVTATVYGRDWRDRCCVMGETRTVLTPADQLRVSLPGATVPPGVYRLSATAFLLQRTPASPLVRGWTTTLNSGLLQMV